MKSQSYMNRALRARDPRFATILGKLGYERADMQAAASNVKSASLAKELDANTPSKKAEGDLTDLRKRYHQKFGKRPYKNWDAEELAAKLAAED